MLQDLRYAIRSLLRTPLVAVCAALALGLGIGGATAVFSVVEAVVLRPLPFPEPDRLVRVWELTQDGDRFSFSEPNYLDLRSASRALTDVAAYSELGTTAVLSSAGEPQRLTVVPASASLFDALGVRPQAGRIFTDAEDRPEVRPRPVVLSERLWRQRFAASPDLVGRIATLDGEPFTITGVMPAQFDFPGGTDAWVPLAADAHGDRGDKTLAVIGRLAPGATLPQLRGELRKIARRLSDQYPEFNANWSADAVSFNEWIVAPRFRDAVWVLFAAVGLLLLLACANVANLLVARGVSRIGEIQTRRALGASGLRLVRQLFTESALLAIIGTGAGVLTAVWSVEVMQALGRGRIPRLDQVRVDGSVLGFACLAGMASCVIFGLAPAWHAVRVDLRPASSGTRTHTAPGRRVRHLLVVAEVALAFVLVVSAGLMAHSFVRLVNVEPGFDIDGTFAVPIDLPPGRYPDDRVGPFYAELLDRLRRVPGVTQAAATSTNPFRQSGFSNSVTPEERAADAPPSGLVQAGWRSVTPGFFETLGIPVLRGRTFGPADDARAERVVLVSDTLARRLWPGESPVGRRIYWGGTTGRTRTVIGVAGDIRDVQLEAEPPPMLYVPHAQVDLPSMTVVIRASGWSASTAASIRDVVRSVDPALPAAPIEDIAASRSEVAAGPRFNLSLLAAFAAIGLGLAGTGVYAMLAFTVSERRREIAVRLALGAKGTHIAGFVLWNGFALALAGIAAGAIAALGVTRALAAQLYSIDATDPMTFAAGAATLIVVAALACYGPARQASKVEPAALLRE